MRVNPDWHRGISYAVDEAAHVLQECVHILRLNCRLDSTTKQLLNADEYDLASGTQILSALELAISDALKLSAEVLKTTVQPVPQGDAAIALTILESLTPPDQSLIEKFAAGERKLLELLFTCIGLLNSAISATNLRPLYVLHYQLSADAVQLELQNNDNEEFFVKKNAAIDARVQQLKQRVIALESQFDPKLCIWGKGGQLVGAKSLWQQILKRNLASDIDAAAVGLSYRTVFGSTSDQIHFNASTYKTKDMPAYQLQAGLEYIILLCTAILLRMANALQGCGATLSSRTKGWMSLVMSVIPADYAAAVLDFAQVGDVVIALSLGESFAGTVTDTIDPTQRTWRYGSYEVERASDQTKDWYPSTAVTLVVPTAQAGTFEQAAREFVATQGLSTAQIVEALMVDTFGRKLVHEFIQQNDPVISFFIDLAKRLPA